MDHLALIRAVAGSLRRRGVDPETAADAATSAWLAAWERAGRAAVPRRRPVQLDAMRLARPGRGGRSRAVAPLRCAELDPAGGAADLALAIDAASAAALDPRKAIPRLRAAGQSLADIGAACGVSGEAVRGWAAGAEPGPARRAALLDALRRLAS